MAKRAVFLDRDNTIIDDPGYLSDPNAVKLLPGVELAIKSFAQAGFTVVVVTNQSAVARGMITEEMLDEIHDEMRRQLTGKGARIDGIYYCPYHPEGSVEAYAKDSELRKPRPGMLLKAAKEMNIDLAASWMIGDSPRDVEAGKRAGCKTIRIRLPKGKANGQPETPDNADFYVRNLVDAARVVMREIKNPTVAPPSSAQTASASAAAETVAAPAPQSPAQAPRPKPAPQAAQPPRTAQSRPPEQNQPPSPAAEQREKQAAAQPPLPLGIEAIHQPPAASARKPKAQTIQARQEAQHQPAQDQARKPQPDQADQQAPQSQPAEPEAQAQAPAADAQQPPQPDSSQEQDMAPTAPANPQPQPASNSAQRRPTQPAPAPAMDDPQTQRGDDERLAAAIFRQMQENAQFAEAPPEKFCLSKLFAAVIQVVAGIVLLFVISRILTGSDPTNAILWALVAIVLQVMALTFYVMKPNQ